MRVGIQLSLVAEQRRHLAGVNSTAHPRQQLGVVRGRADGLIHPGRRPEPHGDNGLPIPATFRFLEAAQQPVPAR